MEKKKIKQKLLAVSTAIAIMLNLPFAMDLTVKAAEHTNHKVCINADSHTCTHSDVTWSEWTSGNSLPTSGNYYLTQDVTVTAETVIAKNTELSLCLNGCTITMDSGAAGESIYKVKGTLNLSDCKNTGKLTGVSYLEGTGNAPVYISYVGDSNAGRFNMYSGTITGNSADNAGGVYVDQKAVFNMYGGKISNNACAYEYTGGGGVSIYAGTFTMFGGTISGNTALKGGGGVYSYYGTFIMNGGTITKNGGTNPEDCPTCGGGVYVSRGGTFTMNSGNISSNKAESTGGGVYSEGTFEMYSGATISSNESISDCGGGVGSLGTFIMHGGEISDNTAMSGGGGVYNTGKFEMSGGTISGNSPMMDNGGGVYNSGTFTIDGTVNITSNSRNNVYLSGSKIITIGSSFNTDSSVGVTTSKTPTCAAPVAITGTTNTDISSSFTSDNSAYSIIYEENVLKLTGSHTFPDTYSKNENDHWRDCTTCSKQEKEAHTWVNSGIKTDPTLTSAGSQPIKCSACDYQSTKEIPILTDTNAWSKTVEKYPTLTDKGKYTYTSKESTFDDVTVDVPVLTDPTWTQKEFTKEPTITADGKCKFTSDTYGEVEVTVPDLSDTNTWTKVGFVTKPTLESAGSYKFKNDTYGEVEVTVPALSDTGTWTKVGFVTKPTLESAGTYKYTSTAYGEVTVAVPQLNDDSVWTKDPQQHVDPTEDSNGKDVYTSENFDPVTITIPKLDHTHKWGTWTLSTVPTIDTAGEATRTCEKDSSHTETVTVPDLSDTNTWTKVGFVTKPTLENEGTYKFTNDTYGEVEVTVPALSNTATWTKDPQQHVDPTEDSNGKDVYTSENFDPVTITIPKLDHTHKWGTWALSTVPTIDTAGEATRTCEKDSSHTETATVPDLSDTNTWTKVGFVTKPTLENEGTYKFTNDTYGDVTAAIPALSDINVWAKVEGECIEPTEDTAGKDVYISIYGKVEVILAELGHTHNLVKVEGVPATETETGIKEHWHCPGCDKNFSDENGTTEITDLTIPKLDHTHNLEKVEGVPATETEAGVKEHWKCTGCGKLFSDENGTTEIADVTIPATGGSQSSESSSTDPTPSESSSTDPTPSESSSTDPTPSESSSNNPDPSETSSNTPVNPPSTTTTTSEPTPAETIPTTEPDPTDSDFFPNIDLGSIVKEVEQKEDVPTADLATPVKELLQAIMPTEELAAIKDTDNIKIILKVEDASETVPTEDKQRVETVLQENESLVLGQYLDVTLLKVINGSETKIVNTNAPITVTFEIPENFRKANREFAVIRVHEDERTVLNDLDNDPDTVTIETDKFSTYALAYTDKEANPETGVYVSIIPLAIAATSLGALVIKKNKKSSK